jgi:hypothetical protein
MIEAALPLGAPASQPNGGALSRRRKATIHLGGPDACMAAAAERLAIFFMKQQVT